MENILFIIDELEYKYFELNKLVTNFWLIYEYLLRGNIVHVCTKNMLYQTNNNPFALCNKAYIKDGNIFKSENIITNSLNNFNIIFFRPDPPIDTDYINASYILSYIANPDTHVINSAQAIREKNEKLYVNEFQGLIPDNIVSANKKIIRNFLFEKHEIIIKPTNRCFGSGVFYLNDKDKNINSIIKTATNSGNTMVMVQEYLPEIVNGDKRLIYICGKIFDYCVKKVATNDDFKFNEHNQNTLRFAQLTDEEKLIESQVKDKFENDGIYLAGLDVIDGKIIEINITSPCFFINEINTIFNINFEKIIVDRIESYIKSKNKEILKI